jgi:hypothetical protein
MSEVRIRGGDDGLAMIIARPRRENLRLIE